MSNKRLTLKKSAFYSRRKLIISLVIMILVLGIVSGFTNTFETDNTIHKAGYGETIVMEAETPTDGAPSDYDALDNLRFAAYKLHHASSFRGETDGVAVADIKFTTYSQHLRNSRVVMGGNKVFAETVSSSSLKNLGEQKYIEDDIVVFRPSTKVSASSTTFAPEAYLMSFENFSDKYGAVPNQISKYIINEKTILSVVDENAPEKKSALNSRNSTTAQAEDGEISYYVPENLVRGEDGNYKFTVTLDPETSTVYYRNEVRTLGGADSNPKFYSAKITFEIDGNWTPIRVTTVENYDIAIPVLGAMNCTGTNIETFSDFDAVTELPEQDFYKPYVEEAKKTPGYVPPDVPIVTPTSPADYLAAAFSEYLTGETPLVLTADIESDVLSVNGLALSLDLKKFDVQAMLGNLYVKRADGKVYIKLNDINGYIPEADFAALLNDERIKGILGGLESIDFAGLLGDDMLGTVFGNCEMTTEDGTTCIHIPFSLDTKDIGIDKVDIDASIFIDDESKALKSITGKITVGDTTIGITAKPPRRAPRFPSTDGATDISGVLDFIPDLISVVQQKTYGIAGTVTVDGTDIGVSAYVDRNDGLKAAATISVLGLDVDIKYVNSEILVTLGNIEVRGTTDDIPELVSAIIALAGDGLSEYKDLLKLVMPTTVSDFINMVKSLEVTDGSLDIGLSALTVPVKLSLARADGRITSVSLGLDVDMLGIKLAAAAKLDITEPEPQEVEIPEADGAYITVAELSELVSQLKPYLESADYDVALDADVTLGDKTYGISATLGVDGITGELKAAGNISALGQTAAVTYTDGVAYISVGNLKLKLDTAELDKLASPVMRIIGMLTPNGGNSFDFGDINAAALLSAIKGISVNDDGAVVVTVALGDINAEAAVNLKNGEISLNIADLLSVDGKITPAAAHGIAAPADADKYVSLAALGIGVDKVADILEQKSLTATIEVTVGGTNIPLDIQLDFNDVLKLRATQTELGLDLVFVDNVIYIALGEIRISAKVSDIPALFEALGDIIPAGLTDIGGISLNNVDIETALAAALGAIVEFTEDDGNISLAAIIDKIGVTLDADTALSAATVKIAIGDTLVTVSANDIAVKAVNISAPANADKYVTASALIPTIKAALGIAEQKSLTATAKITVGDENIPLNIELDFNGGLKLRATQAELGLDVVFVDNVVYIALGEIRISASMTDIPALLDALDGIIPENFANIGGISLGGDILATVKTVVGMVTRFGESNGTLDIGVKYGDIVASVSAATDLNSAAVNVTLGNTQIGLALNEIKAEQTEISAPSGEYVSLATLLPAVEQAVRIYKEKSLTAAASVTMGDIKLDLDIALAFGKGLSARVTESNYGLDIKLIGNTAYVAYGDIKVFGTKDDIPAILELLKDFIPADVANTVTNIMNGNMFGGADAVAIIKAVAGYVTGFGVKDGKLDIALDIDGKVITLDAATDLSKVTVGALGATVILSDIQAAPVSVSVTGEYVHIGEVVAMAKPILPLASAQGLDMNVDIRLLGTTVRGSVYMFFGGESIGFTLDAKLTVGDVPLRLTLKDGMLYIAIADSLCVYEQATEQALYELADKIDYAAPGFGKKVRDIVAALKSITLEKLLGCISTEPAANGFNAVLDMNKVGTNVTVVFGITTAGGALDTLSIDCDIMGFKFDATLKAQIADGMLTGLNTLPRRGNEGDAVIDSAVITLEKTGYRLPNIDESKYIALSRLTAYVAPVYDLITNNKALGSLALDMTATLVTPNNAYTTITGKAVVSLDPLAVQVDIVLFAGTENATELNIVYSGTTAYVKAGKIMLSLDTASDFERLYNVLKNYLPDYINTEIAKLLGLEQGASAFSDIALLIDRFKEIASAQNAIDAVPLLFSALEGINSSSALKTALDTVRVFDRNGALAVGLNVMGITLNMTPVLSDDGAALVSASLDTNLMGYSLKLDVESFTLAATTTDIPAPANADEYVSVMTFVEAVNNAIGTFTQTDVDGNITFEVETFNFDYNIFEVETTTDEFGNTVNVKDDAGRDKPKTDGAGNKIIAKTVKVQNKPNNSALKGKFVKTEQKDDAGNVISTSYKFNLEAHIVLDISSLTNSTPLTLDLYVINNDEQQIAFLDYLEGGSGKGERISIDYTSIMQIVAAALDIMGVDDEVCDMLFGDYRLDIDTAVFDSMAIAGLDDIKTMLENVVAAALDVKHGIAEAQAAWDMFYTAGSIDALNDRFDDIKAKLDSALEIVKSAIALFGKSNGAADTEPETPTATAINGKLFKDIVTGVGFESGENFIKANVDNDIATGTEGTSSVTVTQNADKLERIKVENLDVNTAKLNDFDAKFTAGKTIDVSLPADYNKDTSASTYSDFANIKHLLFDIMNTANMLEFDIGGLDTSDAISVNMTLGADWLANLKLNVKYNAKVKIIKVGEDNGKPVYKTAAAIEIRNQKTQLEILGIGSKIIVPDCTTRLYFYDDVLYVQGVRSWQTSKERVVGYISEIKCIADVWGKKQTRYPNVNSRDYVANVDYNIDYVNVMYTVDELLQMIKTDMGRFLDEFLFYLVPITTEKIAGQDIRGLIKNNISGSGSSDNKDTSSKTIAQIFKGYKYTDGKHYLNIGLAELASSSSLGDLEISLVGANNSDDIVTNNYISSLNVKTAIAGIIKINLDATLRNVAVTVDGKDIYSKGLAPTNITQANGSFSANNKNYLLECSHYDRNTLYTLDGLLYLTSNDELYTANGSYAPVLVPTDSSDTFTWTSTLAETRYCDSVYKFGDTGATYYYTTALSGYGYRRVGERDTYYIGVDANGNKYVYRMENGAQIRVEVKGITESILAEVARDSEGKITSVTNRTGGIQWERIWANI